MDFKHTDFNGATRYFSGKGATRWSEIDSILTGLTPQFQASDQKERLGRPIFDPKATNAALTAAASSVQWHEVKVPKELQSFGTGWDAGRGAVLAEWQFSNYPFLWNNITRTELVAKDKVPTPPLISPAEALIVVTKSGILPASNSTLYYEQAQDQLRRVTALNIFSLPIRLVGLTLPLNVATITGGWNTYGGRTQRDVRQAATVTFDVSWHALKRGGQRAILALQAVPS